MKKPFLLALLSFILVFCAQAQEGVMAKKGDRGLYIEHKVGQGEGLYAIGRMYNVHPRTVAAANKMDMNKGLDIGQVIRIPLTDTNFIQKGNTGTPVYYTVGANEGLMTVSNAANKVTLQSLRNWNGLTSDQLQAGQKLIVGFVKATNLPTTTIKASPGNTKPTEEVAAVVEKPVEKVKQEEVKPKIIDQAPPVVKKEEPKPVKQESVIPAGATNSDQGFFKPYFEQQVKKSPAKNDQTVTAGIFKTTSGWQDGKYYLLIDNLAPGSIVKISYPTTGKTIYAKVLGEMSGISLNQGLGIRISNAAAATLGVTDTEKFIVQIVY